MNAKRKITHLFPSAPKPLNDLPELTANLADSYARLLSEYVMLRDIVGELRTELIDMVGEDFMGQRAGITVHTYKDEKGDVQLVVTTPAPDLSLLTLRKP